MLATITQTCGPSAHWFGTRSRLFPVKLTVEISSQHWGDSSKPESACLSPPSYALQWRIAFNHLCADASTQRGHSHSEPSSSLIAEGKYPRNRCRGWPSSGFRQSVPLKIKHGCAWIAKLVINLHDESVCYVTRSSLGFSGAFHCRNAEQQCPCSLTSKGK